MATPSTTTEHRIAFARAARAAGISPDRVSLLIANRIARLEAISASLDRIEEHLGLEPIDDVEPQEVPFRRVA